MTQEIFEISIEVDNEPQRTLFHYTSHASLIKIIESEKLFATGIRYLNDSSEFRYTEELFVKHIDSHFHIFDEKAKDWFLWLRKTLSAENELRGSAYVTCFTEEKDLLSQWRAYCPQGAGYSLGFSPQLILDSANKQKFDIVKCIYDIDKQQEAIENAIEQSEKEFLTEQDDIIIDDIKHLKKNDITKRVLAMWGKIMRTIQHIAPIFKHPSFKEEREWRAISHEFSLFNTEASWRPGKNIPIPYIFFDLPKVDDKKEISEVVIGPTPNPLLSSITAMSLVKGNGYTCTKFTDSIIPYREW